MKHVLRRLGRLLVQSRIRLSATDLRPASLLVGDRLLIADRLWRVVAHEVGDGTAIEAVDGPPSRARLQPAMDGWTWIEGAVRLPLARRDVLVLTAGEGHV